MFAVALDPIQQKLGAECPFPAKMVDWAQNKVVICNIDMSIVNEHQYHNDINLIFFNIRFIEEKKIAPFREEVKKIDKI